MSFNRVNKKNFKDSEDIIRKAFKIYSEKDLEKSEQNFDFEYDDEKLFEDKVYSVIKKLPINNPRIKAHIICVTLICLVLLSVFIVGYLYYGSREAASQTKVVEEICREARKRFETSGKNYTEITDYVGGCMLEEYWKTNQERNKYVRNMQNTAIYVNKDDYKKSGYLYSFYPISSDEEKRITDNDIELVSALDNEQLSPFLRNSLDLRKGEVYPYSKGSIYFIGGRKSRKFIIFKDRADLMYIGKCVGFESLENYDIVSDKKAYEKVKKEAASGEKYFKNIMDINDGGDVREIMLERVEAKSSENSDKRIATWTDNASKKELYELFAKGNSISRDEKCEDKFAIIADKNPEKCYYLAFENREGETTVFGIILGEKEIEMYIEPQHGEGTVMKLSASNGNKIKELIEKYDK